MIVFRTRRGVAKYVRKVLHGFRPLLSVRLNLRHRITVHVVPAPVVRDEETGDCGFGLFDVMDGEPHIYLAAGLSWWIRKLEISRTEALVQLLRTLVHELAHYEQWRDGKPRQERGVRVRTRNLCRRLGLPCTK